MHKLKRIQLERVTEAIRKHDTQPLMIVTGDMPVTWSTPRATPLPASLEDEITQKRHTVTPDEWLLLRAQQVELASDDDWLR